MKCLSTLIHSLNTYFTSFYFQNLKKQKYLFTSIVLRSSSYSTKIALKWTKIMLQSSVIPIWNPQNQGYKIGNIYNYWDQPWSPKNGLEMLLRILSANTVVYIYILTCKMYVSFHHLSCNFFRNKWLLFSEYFRTTCIIREAFEVL